MTVPIRPDDLGSWLHEYLWSLQAPPGVAPDATSVVGKGPVAFPAPTRTAGPASAHGEQLPVPLGHAEELNPRHPVTPLDALDALTGLPTAGRAGWSFGQALHAGDHVGALGALATAAFAGGMPLERKGAEKLAARIPGAGDRFAILTAENAGGKAMSTAENATRNASLAKRLSDAGLSHSAVKGAYTDDVSGQLLHENSFLVHGIAPQHAEQLGREFGQNGVVTHEGYHDLAGNKLHPSRGIQADVADAPYTELADGRRFASDIDWSKSQPLLPKTANPAILDIVNGLRTGPKMPRITAINADKAAAMAKTYAGLPKYDPAARGAYDALNTEVSAQYKALTDAGYKFDFVDKDPYKSSTEMMDDVRHNKTLKVFKTPGDAEFHPYMTPAQNDRFRAVHDAVAHAGEGNQFGPVGEENAYRVHASTLSPTAQRALATETRGQNSWVNFGPNAHLPVRERPFAEQKAALWPEHLLGDYDQMQAPPITAYHGTNTAFDTFDPAKIGSRTDAGHLGQGHYFSTDPRVIDGSSIGKKVQLQFSNPLKISLPNMTTDKRRVVRDALGLPSTASAEEVTAAAKARGHDGVELDYSPAGYNHRELVAFDPKQIASPYETTPTAVGTAGRAGWGLGQLLHAGDHAGAIEAIASALPKPPARIGVPPSFRVPIGETSTRRRMSDVDNLLSALEANPQTPFTPESRGVFDRSHFDPDYRMLDGQNTMPAARGKYDDELANRLDSKKVREQMERQVQLGLPLGGRGFYNLEPVKASFGDIKSGLLNSFEDFNAASTAGSIQSPLPLELSNANLMLYAKANNISYGEAKAEMARRYPDFAAPWLSKTHTQQFDNYLKSGVIDPASPTSGGRKLPSYGRTKLGESAPTSTPVFDTHESKALLYPLGLDNYVQNLTGAQYETVGDFYRNMAKRLDLRVDQVQAGRWFGGGPLTGLKSPRGDYPQQVEDMLKFTAQQTGKDDSPAGLRKLWGDVTQGRDFLKPWYGKGALPIK